MAEVRIQTQDGGNMKNEPLKAEVDELILEMGSEVEVIAIPKRGRGRPRLNRNFSAPKSSDEESIPPKRAYRKRSNKSTENVPKVKRKFPKFDQSDDETYDVKKDKEKRNRRVRRKRDSDDRKTHSSKDKNQHRKPTPRSHASDAERDDVEKIVSSDEGSVVIMDHIPPPVVIPSTPPDDSPSSDVELDRPRRLEDSSSGNSSSSSSSDSDSDSDSSIGSRLTDKSDRSPQHSPPANNRYDASHRSPSPLNWSRASSSGTEDEDGNKTKNGSSATAGTPPRSPSSASSESPDKSFQCHTCKKWFSSTVTLRIHKRTHLQKPGATTSNSRNSRRYECDCCDATFTRRERLEQHRSDKHCNLSIERCEVCGRCFEDSEQRQRHVSSHTDDERAGRCTECGKISGSWEQLRRHRSVHASPAPHACPLCRKAFTYVHSLSRHMLNHSKAVYKCVVCKTSFDDANSLAQHLNSHLDRYKQLKT